MKVRSLNYSPVMNAQHMLMSISLHQTVVDTASLHGANCRLGSSRGDTLHQALLLLSTPCMLPLLSC